MDRTLVASEHFTEEQLELLRNQARMSKYAWKTLKKNRAITTGNGFTTRHHGGPGPSDLGRKRYQTPKGIAIAIAAMQRLAIARALARKPAILVLDEATSHLDVMTESAVDGNLNQLPCTRIVIAHRLSTIRNADKIFVLEQGCVVEQGTHDELVAVGRSYAALVRSQMERPQPNGMGGRLDVLPIVGAEIPASL